MVQSLLSRPISYSRVVYQGSEVPILSTCLAVVAKVLEFLRRASTIGELLPSLGRDVLWRLTVSVDCPRLEEKLSIYAFGGRVSIGSTRGADDLRNMRNRRGDLDLGSFRGVATTGSIGSSNGAISLARLG